jgi:hypothetical protein
MARIPPLSEQSASDHTKAAFNEHRTRYNARITNIFSNVTETDLDDYLST